MFGTCNTFESTRSFPEVSFSMTLPFPSIFEAVPFPMNIGSDSFTFWYDTNILLELKMCFVAPVSSHQSTTLVVKKDSITPANSFSCGDNP
ncbi:hypothetical protein Tco_0683891 [Tanacetum coccineum]